MVIKFKKLVPEAAIPHHGSLGAAGYDLTAVSKTWDDATHTMTYGTGLAVEIPEGYVGLIFPRSSVYQKGLTLSNCVGVIDSDYRGEILAKFYWTVIGAKPYHIGDRVCQLVVVPYTVVEWEEAEVLSETARGMNGYGSTGI